MINIWTAERSHLSTSHISIFHFSHFRSFPELPGGELLFLGVESSYESTAVGCAMSCLTGVLQLLQVLTTLSGCNIYSYAEDRRVFRTHPKTHRRVRAMHRFWLRPWLMVTLVMYSTYWVLEFLRGLTDVRPGSERPLSLIYEIGLTVAIHQNFVITLGMAYYYR